MSPQPRIVNLDGVKHTFPPDATDEEIRQALEGGGPSGSRANPQQQTRGGRSGGAQGTDADSGSQLTTPKQPGQKTGFFGRVAENLNPVPLISSLVPESLGGAGPINTVKKIFTPNEGKAQESAAAVAQGKYGRATLSGAESIPVVGPIIQQGEQDVKNKDWGALAGTAASLLLPKALGKVKGNIRIPSTLNPVEQSAVAYGERAGVPVDLGTATNNQFVKAAQGTVEKLPLTSGKAARLAEQRSDAMVRAGGDLARSVDPTGTGNSVVAGEGVGGALTQRVASQNALADTAYSKLRQIADQNKKRIQVGTKPDTVLDASGNPIQVPIYEDIALPTDPSAVKAKIKPILDQLEKSIPEAQKQASPGLTILRQIMQRPDAIDINTAIQDLSAVQNLGRTPMGELPQVQGVSAGLAKMVIPEYRRAIDAAAAAGGPDATAALNEGRAATTAKYAADSVRKALPKNGMGEIEPGRVVDRLAAPDDGGIQLLRQVQQHTPQAIPSVARSVITEIIDDMTYQGGVRRPQSAVRSWHKIGDETKAILFPDPNIRQSITDYVNLAEMMGRKANPSGSATTGAAILSSLSPKLIAAQLFAGKPVTDLLFGGGGAALARNGVPFSLGPAPKAVGAVVGSNQVLPDTIARRLSQAALGGQQ